MAVSKSQKIQAEIDKVKAKISEQQARLKELEQKKLEAENSEIVDIVRGMSISLEELPLVLQRLRDGGTSGQSVQKSGGFGELPNQHFCKGLGLAKIASVDTLALLAETCGPPNSTFENMGVTLRPPLCFSIECARIKIKTKKYLYRL